MKRGHSILAAGLTFSLVVIAILLSIIFLREEDEMVLVLIASFGILFFVAGIFYFLLQIYYPLVCLKNILKSLAGAELLQKEDPGTAKEFREIDYFLRIHTGRLKELVGMANSLAEGRIDNDFKLLGEDDEPGKALLRVKESIQASNKEAVRRRELDEQQNWTSHGIALFGELLRDFENNVEQLSGTFIRNLAEYMEMEVGGLFLRSTEETNEPVFVLTGAYAFDRNKLTGRAFHVGEGLVGRCALEKSIIIMTDVPKDYIRIRSGMGEDSPSTLVLVPVLLDEEVLGVIELASFSEVPGYKIDFLELLGRSIASIVSKAEVKRAN